MTSVGASAATPTLPTSPPDRTDSADNGFNKWSNAWQASKTRYSAYEWVEMDVKNRVEARAGALRAQIADLDKKIKDHPDDIERIKAWKSERANILMTIATFEREEAGNLPEDQRQAYDYFVKRNAINKMFLDDLINKIFFEKEAEPEEDPL